MLVNQTLNEVPRFEMHASYSQSINIEFANFFSFIENDYHPNKIVFIDPVVLSNHQRFLDLESSDRSLKLVPTNLHEENKNIDSFLAILDVIESQGTGRKDTLLAAVGGGALLDIVSFAASVFRRGISVVKVPTTLLGIVDASIGIKTGINFSGQRNRLGSYHLDYSVIVDPMLLKGLTPFLLRQGLGEIFKIAIIKSRTLFNLLSDNINRLEELSFYQSPEGVTVLSQSIQLMLEELHDNPREQNLKRCVDFGHSFSPLVEMESNTNSNYRTLPHGFSVAYDCLLTATIAWQRGILPSDQYHLIVDMYLRFDFDFINPIYNDINLVWASFLEMTKHRGGNQNLPVPNEIGSFEFIQDVTFDEVRFCSLHLKGLLSK